MKQPKIHIKDNYRDWGLFDVMVIYWNDQHKIYSINVDWFKNGENTLVMFDYDSTGEFINPQGNLKGTLIEN